MRWLYRLFVFSLLLIPIGLVVIAALCLEAEPKVPTQVLMNAANVERAKRLVHEYDPRKMQAGEVKTVRMSADELRLVLSYIVDGIGPGGAVVELAENQIRMRATISVQKVAPGGFLNIDSTISSANDRAQIENLKIGHVNFPRPIVRWLSGAAVRYVYRASNVDRTRDLIRAIDIKPDYLDVTYAWEAAIVDAVRDRIISSDDRDKLQHYNEILAQEIERGIADPTFANLVRALFSNARQRSDEGGAVAENRAAILVLGAYVNGRSLAALAPQASSWTKPNRIHLQVHGRRDLVQHFATSAALAVAGGSVFADTLGLVKEIDDAAGGSGFSFKDLAADRSGTRFGQFAVESELSARKLQQLVSEQIDDVSLVPDPIGLEEKLSDAEFRRRYGGVDGRAYESIVAEIARRIDASRLYRR
ncbi:MAG: hypothetical protein ACI915_003540 [Gammaproteobacteria bacterium]